MPTVVRPGRQLVDDEVAVDHEELDREHTHVVERVGDREREPDRPIGERGGNGRRHHGQIEDAVDVGVLRDRIRHERTAAPTGPR